MEFKMRVHMCTTESCFAETTSMNMSPSVGTFFSPNKLEVTVCKTKFKCTVMNNIALCFVNWCLLPQKERGCVFTQCFKHTVMLRVITFWWFSKLLHDYNQYCYSIYNPHKLWVNKSYDVIVLSRTRGCKSTHILYLKWFCQISKLTHRGYMPLWRRGVWNFLPRSF